MNRQYKIESKTFKQEGTSRLERYAAELNPDTIVIDDRKLQDFIKFTQKFSKNLRFFDAENNAIGSPESWEYFFNNDNDVILLIASIAGSDVKEIQLAYDFLHQKFQNKKTVQSFIELIKHTFSRFERIESWNKSSSNDKESRLYNDLQLYIASQLQQSLTNLLEIVIHIRGLLTENDAPTEQEIQILRVLIESQLQNESWHNGSPKGNHAFGMRVLIGDNDEQKLANAAILLNEIFDTVFHVTENIVASCNSFFDETTALNQNHPPHIGLLITFFKLFAYEQAALNKIPKKHLDFYYQDVLNIKNKEAIPDQVFVVFELTKDVEQCEIPKGTALTAGKDHQNVEQIYEIDKDIVLSKAQIGAVKTIFIDKDPISQIKQYYAKTIDISKNTAWNVFGKPEIGQEATVGFAIASSQFALSKGSRNIIIGLEIANEIKIETFDNDLVTVLLTGEKGWLSSGNPKDGITVNSITFNTDNKTIELNFSVSITQQSFIVAFDKKIHSGNFSTNLPVFQCLLNYSADNSAKIKQANLFQNCKITQTSIQIQVGSNNEQASFDGVRDLILQNHEAVLDNTKPFQPFTAIPKVGSSFYISCPDFSEKPIENLSLNIEWMLPDKFNTYYENYPPPYDDNDFGATLSVLKNNNWVKIKDVSILGGGNNSNFLSIKIENQDWKSISDAAKIDSEATDGISKFDVFKMEGTLKLKLNSPDFGQSIYPQLIMAKALEKASTPQKTEDYEGMIQAELEKNNASININLPTDIDKTDGSFKAIYNILKIADQQPVQARNMMTQSFCKIIKQFNESKPAIETATSPAFPPKILEFVAKILPVTTKKSSLMVNQTNDALVSLITDEMDNVIDKTVEVVVDKILAQRTSPTTDEPALVSKTLNDAFQEANKSIKDFIVKHVMVALSTNDIPPPPYTPLINTLSVNYSSEKLCKRGEEQFFRITPFGVVTIDPFVGNDSKIQAETIATNQFFPKTILLDESFAQNTLTDDIESENKLTEPLPTAMFFLGIQDLIQNQNLSVLFQVAEGTRFTDSKPPTVYWRYLSDNKWVKLSADAIVADGTMGFQQTGIIEFSLPQNINNTNTAFDLPDLFWLAAFVSADSEAFPKMIALATNATTATFVNQANAADHAALALPAQTIKNFVEKNPLVKKVMQPVSSFGGKVKEEGESYYTRVSERLRHKNRAVNNWDFERLVLEEFAFVFKVKCLNNYYNGNFVQGHITVVPICDLRNKDNENFDRLIPKASYVELKKMEDFLVKKVSPFVKIHAINPQLDHVLISCQVKFNQGIDKGFYLKKLNEDLIEFLTPWASGNAESVMFTSKIYASSIINFIDKRTYVDYLTDLVMSQYTEDEQGIQTFYKQDGTKSKNKNEALVETQPTTEHSILVSAPKHIIKLIE